MTVATGLRPRLAAERLRRARRPRDARGHLVDAAQLFARSGAVPQPLSSREYQVCRAAADGVANKDIAAAFFISPKTVEYTLNKAFTKLGVTNRTQAARLLADEPQARLH
ncbi:MAG: helix-turn-helix domain-containing protein [Acidimicrobiales bacterium]